MRFLISFSFMLLVVVAQPAPAQEETCDYGPAYDATEWLCVGGSNPGASCSYIGDPVCSGGGSCEIGDGGRATFYTYSNNGACGFGIPDPGTYIVAISTPEWAGSAMCGRCLQVTGPLGTIIVKVFDLCPEETNPEWCTFGGHLDLGADAFAAIADPDLGVVPVDWETVACDESGNMGLVNKDGINPWWYAVFVTDHRQGVSNLEIHDADSAVWVAGVRQTYNAWVVQDGEGLVPPLSVRLTDLFGNTIEASDVVTNLDEYSEFDFGSQFPVCQKVLFADDFESENTSAWSATIP